MNRAVEELKQIPFAHLIGAPLKAAIEAQALAAQTTIEFIQEVGFKKNTNNITDMLFENENADASAGELRSLTFRYKKKDENDDDGTSFELTVPLLSIVPIPYIRVDEMTIDFKAKLTDSIKRTRNTSLAINSELNVKYSAFWSPVKVDFRVSAAYKDDTSSASSQTRDYSMDIHIRAIQDQMPAGLSKVLEMLENAIRDKKAITAGSNPA